MIMKNCKWCGASIQDNIIICPHCKANQNTDHTETLNQNFMSLNMINEIYQMTQNIRAIRKDIKFIKDTCVLMIIGAVILFLFLNS